MAKYVHDHTHRKFTNSSGAKLNSGDITKMPDGVAGIVEGLAGVAAGSAGMARVRGVVSVDKASATVIAANDRIQIATATQLATVKASGAADAGNVLAGRAIEAAGSGTLTVLVDLNGQGPTI